MDAVFSRQKYTHLGETNLRRSVRSLKEFVRELNRVNCIVWPMILVSISQFVSRLSPMFILGHLNELSLASASIATTFCNVIGFSALFGMASALETLCGQAHGAGQYRQVGIFTYAAVFSLSLVCLLVSYLWIYTEKLLISVGQDPLVSKEAGKYAIWLIPSLFPYSILQSRIRYLQTQNLILPILLTSLASLFTNLPLCWAFVFKLKLGNCGAALSIGLSYWFNVFLLGIYVKHSSSCKKTHASFSKEAYLNIVIRFLNAKLVIQFRVWSSEVIIFLSGILPNPQLEMNVLSIYMTITSLHFNVPYSLGVAASTQISNEPGAGNPQVARMALCTVLILSAAEFIAAAAAIFMCCCVLGYAFFKEKEAVVYIEEMAPLLCLSIILDSLQAVLSEVARGGSWQQIGAYVNLGAHYVVGLPVALLMGFAIHFKGKGLWIGLVAGAGVPCFLLSVVTLLTDWKKQAVEARQRIFEGTIPSQIEPT